MQSIPFIQKKMVLELLQNNTLLARVVIKIVSDLFP